MCGKQFDHTSVLQFLEEFTGVRESNISDWRRNTFGNLSAALQFQDAGTAAPSMPDTSGSLRLAKYESSMLPTPILPGENQQLPKQEKGSRKSVANGKD